MNDVNDNNEILPLEEEKKKGFNKTILYIAIPLVLIIGVICYLYFKTNIVTIAKNIISIASLVHKILTCGLFKLLSFLFAVNEETPINASNIAFPTHKIT